MSDFPTQARLATLDFDGWVNQLAPDVRERVKLEVSLAHDKPAYIQRLQSTMFLSAKLGYPMGFTLENFQDAKKGYIQRAGWGDANMDDAAFNARVKEQGTREQAKKVYREGKDGNTEEAQKLRDASLSGLAYAAGSKWGSDPEESFLQFQKWQEGMKANPNYDPKDSATDYAVWSARYAEGFADRLAAQPAAEEAYTILADSDTDRRQARKAVPLFRDLTPAQRALAVQGISELGKRQGSTVEAQGAGSQMATAFGRTIAGMVTGLDRGFERDRLLSFKFEEGMTEAAKDDDEGEIRYWLGETHNPAKPLLGAGTMTAERAAKLNAAVKQRLSDLQIEAELEDIATGKVNPLRRETWYQKMAIGGSESLGAMAVIAVPGAGFAAASNAYRNDAVEKYVAAGIPLEKAQALAWVTGPVQGGLDRVQLGLLKKMPGLGSWLEKWSTKAMVNLAARVTGTTLAETGIELAQDQLVPALVQDVAAWWDKEVPGVKWAEVAKESWAQTPDTLLAVLPLALVGGGAATYRDFKNFRELATDPDRMKAAGFTPAHIAAVQMTETDAEAAALVRQFWPERVKPKKVDKGTGKADSTEAGGSLILAPEKEPPSNSLSATGGAESESTTIAEGEHNTSDDQEATAPAIGESDGGTGSQDAISGDETASARVRSLRLDDNGWYVELEDGSRVQTGSVDAAIHLQNTLHRAADEAQAAAMVELAEEIRRRDQKEGKTSVQILTGDVADYTRGQGLTRTDAQGRSRTVQFNPENLERQLQAMAPGQTSATLQGRNWVAEDGTTFYESNQSGQGPVTMLHEMAEARLKTILDTGEGQSLAIAAAKIVSPLFDPDKARTAEDKAFAKRLRAIANLDARQQGDPLPSLDEIRETLVELLVGNELGQRKNGARMPAGVLTQALRNAIQLHTGGGKGKDKKGQPRLANRLATLMSVVREWLRGVLGIGAVLNKARRDGKLKDGDDFQKFADKALGISEGKEHNKAVLEANGVDGGKGETFSLGPITLKVDAEYMKAVESGDMAAAQKMVDAAAKAAGYETGPVFHGSGEKFTIFDNSKRNTGTAEYGHGLMFFTDDAWLSDEYASMGSGAFREAQAEVYNAVQDYETLMSEALPDRYSYYMRWENENRATGLLNELLDDGVISREQYDAWDRAVSRVYQATEQMGKEREKPFEPQIYRVFLKMPDAIDYTVEGGVTFGSWNYVNTALAEQMKEEGKSGFIARGVYDSPFGTEQKATVYAVKDPNQIKSADPVTYDGKGNVIPLSQRFNPDRNEITYSLGSADLLEKVARRAEAMPKDPKEKLETYQEMAEDLAGMARAVRWNESAADAVTSAAIETERKDRYRKREAELLQEVDKDFGDIAGAEFAAVATNQPIIDAIMRKAPGDKFPRGRIRSRTRAGENAGGEYDGARDLPRWLFGGTMRPDQMSQELHEAGLISEDSPELMWQEIEKALRSAGAAKDRLSSYGQRRAEARQQAREETNAWAAEQRADLPKRQKDKERVDLTRTLQALDAILFKLPAEVRASVGGFIAAKLSATKTNEGRETILLKTLDKAEKAMEEFLRGEYRQRIDALIEKGKPEKEAGEKPKGKITPEGHRFFERVAAAVNLTADEVEAEHVKLEKLYEADGITDEGRADIFEQQQILDAFGYLNDRPSTDLAAALAKLETVYREGRNKWKFQEEIRLAEVKEKAAGVVDTLGAGLFSKIQGVKAVARKVKQKVKGLALELRNFAGFMRGFLGDNHPLTKEWGDRVRNAFAATDDARRALQKEWDAAVQRATGKKGVKGRRAVWDMANKQTMEVTLKGEATSKTETVPVSVVQNLRAGLDPKGLGLTQDEADALVKTLNENEAGRRKKDYTAKPLEVRRTMRAANDTVKMTEAEGVFITMLAAQEQYRGALDAAGFDVEAVQEIEKGLSDAAKDLRRFLADKYEAGYLPLNQVFSKMFGVDLPQIKNYAPAAFYHQGDEKAKGPGEVLPEGGFRAGFLKTRKQHKAKPRLENAFASFFGHQAQSAHWQAFAELVREMRGVMGRPEVKTAIEGAHGKDGLDLMNDWVKALEGNGIQKAHGQWDRFTGWLLRQASYVHLGWKLGTLMVQSTATLGSAYKIPAGAYLRGMGRLVRGKLDWSQMWKSPTIRRRIETGFAPEVRAALNDLWGAKPTHVQAFLDQGLENLGFVDAFFTTASAAVAWEYHYQGQLKSGANEDQARVVADAAVLEIVSETAQPATVADKSMFEAKQGNLAKLAFLYASDARQKTAMLLEAWGHTLTGKPTKQDIQVLILAHLVVGPMIQAIRNVAWDMQDDDDDEWFDAEHWQDGKKWLMAVGMGPMNGVPLLNDIFSAFETSNAAVGRFKDAGEAIGDLVGGPSKSNPEKGEYYWNRLIKVLKGLDAGTATGAGIADQVFKVSDNLGGKDTGKSRSR